MLTNEVGFVKTRGVRELLDVANFSCTTYFLHRFPGLLRSSR